MKSAVAILVISCLVAVTYAAPSSTQLQQDDDDSARMKDLIDLIDRAAKSQQDDDYDSAEAQFFSSLFKTVKGLWRKHRRGILNGALRLGGKLVNGYLNQGGGGGGSQNIAEANSIVEEQDYDDSARMKELIDLIDRAATLQRDDEDEEDLMTVIESLPEEAQVKLFRLLI